MTTDLGKEPCPVPGCPDVVCAQCLGSGLEIDDHSNAVPCPACTAITQGAAK